MSICFSTGRSSTCVYHGHQNGCPACTVTGASADHLGRPSKLVKGYSGQVTQDLWLVTENILSRSWQTTTRIHGNLKEVECELTNSFRKDRWQTCDPGDKRVTPMCSPDHCDWRCVCGEAAMRDEGEREWGGHLGRVSKAFLSNCDDSVKCEGASKGFDPKGLEGNDLIRYICCCCLWGRDSQTHRSSPELSSKIQIHFPECPLGTLTWLSCLYFLLGMLDLHGLFQIQCSAILPNVAGLKNWHFPWGDWK